MGNEAADDCDALLVAGSQGACIRCLLRILAEMMWVSVLFSCCGLLGLASTPRLFFLLFLFLANNITLLPLSLFNFVLSPSSLHSQCHHVDALREKSLAEPDPGCCPTGMHLAARASIPPTMGPVSLSQPTIQDASGS
jgi:hypothetical protein